MRSKMFNIEGKIYFIILGIFLTFVMRKNKRLLIGGVYEEVN